MLQTYKINTPGTMSIQTYNVFNLMNINNLGNYQLFFTFCSVKCRTYSKVPCVANSRRSTYLG